MNIRLIKVAPSESGRLLEIQKICFAPHLERYQDFETNPSMMPLEEMERRICKENFHKIYMDDLWVGSINIQKLEGDGNYKLFVINILPEYQNMGIGQTAIKLAESLFSDAKSWCLETLEDMSGNRHVYEKMGYHFTGETEKINDKLTLVFYKKTVV